MLQPTFEDRRTQPLTGRHEPGIGLRKLDHPQARPGRLLIDPEPPPDVGQVLA
jgi:hypothetical protein